METNKKIDINKVNELLERYFNAETTLEEEEYLRLYFTKQEVDSELKKYAPLFNYFSQEIGETNFENVLTNSEHILENKNKSIFSYRNTFFRSFSLTAAVALAIFTYFIWPSQQNAFEMTIDGVRVNDQKLAISKTEAQLSKISSMMDLVNQGACSLDKLGNVRKSLSKINGISKNSQDNQKKE